MTTYIGRYVFREIAQAWVMVTGVLLLILVTSQFASTLGDAAASRLPRDAVLDVMWLTSLQYLTILIPIGLLLAILLALGRLYRDSEMYALMACGIGPAQLYKPVFLLAVLLGLGAAWLSLEAGPWAMREVARIGQEARERASLGVMTSGRFVGIAQGSAVVYAEGTTPDGGLRNVFVQRRDGAKVEVVVAEEAWQRETADPGVKMLTFRNGRRFEGEPGSARFTVIEFREHGIPYTVPSRKPSRPDPEVLPVSALLGSAQPADRAELQWRLSVPVMTLILALLALPLSRSSPRQGRYAGVGAAILIYVTYANLLGAARVWVERGAWPTGLGLWWVHLVFFVGALVLLGLRFGLLRRAPGRRPG